MPEISIIVPVYNVETKLKRCLDSIQSQTYSDFEVILVDDGSKDGSGQICDEYALIDKRFKAFHLQNGGASAARNFGVKKAQGQYVGFIDSDDYVSKDYLEKLYQTISIPSADVAMCAFYSCSKGKNSEVLHNFGNSVLEGEELKQKIYKNIIDCETPGYFSLWNKLFCRELIEKNELSLRENMSFGEDMMFVMDFLNVCKKISFINEPLYYYEMAENGLFASYRKSFLHDVLICFERMIEQTKPYQKGKDDLLPLTMKYYNYVYRHMQGIVLHEKKRKKALRETYQNKTVRSIFTRIVQLTNEEMGSFCFDEYEKRIPRLVIEKKIRKAIRKTIYVFDENCLMRRIRQKIEYVRTILSVKD